MSRARTVLATEVALVGGLLAIVGGAYGVEKIAGLSKPVQLCPVLSLLLAAIPAILVLVYFYLQDRHEPEPKHYVFGIYLLGAFVGAPLAGFLLSNVVPVADPQGISSLSGDRIIAAILLVGLVQELAKYIVVRYSVYLSGEFDEPMDGIVYMTAAGLGFATALNFHYLQGLSGNVYLATGIANVVVTTMVHACFAAVLGYALGRARFFEGTPLARSGLLLAGLFGAALLNGAFHLVKQRVETSGLQVHLWRGVAWTVLFALLVFVATWLLMRRQLAASAPEASS